MCWSRSVTASIILLLVFGCDQKPKNNGSSTPEVSKQQVVGLAEAINKRNAINPALNPQIETHFQLVAQILPDDVILSVFDKPKVIKRRVVLEYHDTVSVNGMLQTNCSYQLDNCEVVIHLTLLPNNDANLVKQMRASWKNKDVIRSERSDEKDVFISKGEKHIGGTVFGERLLVSFFARNAGATAGSGFALDEARLWTVLQSIAARVR